LFNLSGVEPAIDRQRVLEKALEFVEAADTGDLARITAFQVCAQAGDPRVLALARPAAEAAPSIAMRVAAIAAVGASGGAIDLPLLKRLQTEPNPSLRVAAAAAIRRIHARTNG
jgi:hypothetical protein